MSFSNTTGAVLWGLDERGVASIVLDRPEVNNAYDGGLVEGLLRATEALKDVAGLRLIVIRGNGRHFQAGADLKWIDAVARSSRPENISAAPSVPPAAGRFGASDNARSASASAPSWSPRLIKTIARHARAPASAPSSATARRASSSVELIVSANPRV